MKLRQLLPLIALTTVANRSSVEAASVDKLSSELADLEREAQNLTVATRGGDQDKLRAERQLVEGLALYQVKDYSRAAILLHDYVRTHPSATDYYEALYYLGDSLYEERIYIPAKEHFNEIVQKHRGDYYPKALQRLLDIALRTHETTDVPRYIEALQNLAVSSVNPYSYYVIGKYYFFSGQYKEAIASFVKIDAGKPHYLRAQYFLGATYIKQNKIDDAARVFQGITSANPSVEAKKTDEEIKELAHLALGRIRYHQGKIPDAISSYSRVSRWSPSFEHALHEIAWSYIKATKFNKAMDSLELLMLAFPQSPLMPEVTVLQGNLLIRQKKWGKATELFAKTSEQYAPLYQHLNKLLQEQQDPQFYFRVLNAKRDTADTAKIQPLALKWAQHEPVVARASELARDVSSIDENLVEIEVLLNRFEKAINSPTKVKAFKDVSVSRTQSNLLENRLAKLRLRVIQREEALAIPALPANEKAAAEKMRDDRAPYDKIIEGLPTSTDQFNERDRSESSKLNSLEADLSKLSVEIQSQKAQLVAAEKYARDTKKDDMLAKLNGKVETDRQYIDGLQTQANETRNSIIEARDSLGIGGTREVAERAAKLEFNRLASEQHRILSTARGQIPTTNIGEFEALASMTDRSVRIEEAITSYNGRLEGEVDNRLVAAREIINAEHANFGTYTGQNQDLHAQANGTAGQMAMSAFRTVRDKVQDLIVRAEVGVIDVSWALKDEKSQNVSSLVRQRKMDIQLLDSEFQDVLQAER